MKKPELIKRILTLLAEKRYSQRMIAKILGVSRGLVSSVASGKQTLLRHKVVDVEYAFQFPGGKPKRCPSCGALVQMPCLACQIRQMRKLRETNILA
ncbi:MAG: hypothetical protein ACRC10_05220 [Thermoguttaceae bacterium]